MNIVELPKHKNITDFTNKEIFLWLKNYISGWASTAVGPQAQYDIIKTELMRRSNERIFKLTIVNIALSVLIFVLALLTFLKG